ncbi:hypothetical protein CBR_g48674 [Chara braunii]|uniref:Cystathionine gamma-synthase n=1 Tax=Chara braunii TaxID=69332 RepID=A0A388K4I3_CHABU|nr:hypothetical protein CBR_g48674 [Chara braunii]|eukprot:GBG64926.1 hypothetical protein CBR_g48674 [Chara braunii]
MTGRSIRVKTGSLENEQTPVHSCIKAVFTSGLKWLNVTAEAASIHASNKWNVVELAVHNPRLRVQVGPSPKMQPDGRIVGTFHRFAGSDLGPAIDLPSSRGPATDDLAHRERAGRPDISDSLTTPLVQTATYTFRNTAEVIAYQEGQHTSYEYGRYGNPTTRVLEKKISALEGAEDTLVFASGMCAATTMLFALVPKNGHIVTTTDCYRRTRQFIQTFLHKLGITTTVIDPADMSALERALHENQVSLFFSESPTNPYLRCIDVQRVAELCHNKGALVCIDGTFATPVNQRSIPLGADIVIHSGTKYLAGHNDILRVHYPGLESHPEHGIAVRQMDGFGGVVSFEINGDLKKTSQFIDNLKLPYIAPSLGGVESLVEQPTVISYWDQSPMERARLGIKDNLVRYSCGIECCDDILQDILQSLDSL